jgi:type II secretory pathway pseudopilin PulG
MARGIRQPGFSVAEVMIAVGILGVALIFIAGVFPVGIRFTEVSTNRTVGTIVASEAFAKIRLTADEIGAKVTLLAYEQQRDFNDWCDEIDISNDYLLDVNTYSYPTDNTVKFENKHYCWSALLRRVDEYIIDPNIISRDVQVTVFVYRKAGNNPKYYKPAFDDLKFPGDTYGLITAEIVALPGPVKIEVDNVTNRDNELRIVTISKRTLINDGALIVDDATGRIYRVLERYAAPNDDFILLDKDFLREDWRGNSLSDPYYIWVVPPPWAPGVGSTWRVSGKNPGIGVYQKVIKF